MSDILVADSIIMLEMGVSGSVGLWVWRVGGLADRERAIFTLLTVSLAHCM